MDETTQDLIIDAKNGAIAETKLDILIKGILATAKKYDYGNNLVFDDTAIGTLIKAIDPYRYEEKEKELQVKKPKTE